MQHKPSPFANPSAIASYVEDAQREVRCCDLHRMAVLFLPTGAGRGPPAHRRRWRGHGDQSPG